MTSSLVGSEMCIRDRGLVTSKRPTEPCPMPESGALAEVPPTRNAPSVSYTHLTLPTICSV
eukprot:3414036-Prorocentrum_lima.AAC.1